MENIDNYKYKMKREKGKMNKIVISNKPNKEYNDQTNAKKQN